MAKQNVGMLTLNSDVGGLLARTLSLRSLASLRASSSRCREVAENVEVRSLKKLILTLKRNECCGCGTLVNEEYVAIACHCFRSKVLKELEGTSILTRIKDAIPDTPMAIFHGACANGRVCPCCGERCAWARGDLVI